MGKLKNYNMVPSFEKFLYFLEKSLEYRFNVLVLTLYIIYIYNIIILKYQPNIVAGK